MRVMLKSFMSKKFVFTLVLLLLIGDVYAQDPFNCADLDFGCDEEFEVPIDSGVIFLMIAGVLLGLRALKKDSNLKGV
jgi:hypothetical protein